jgi:peptidoglycan/xylan/chitin deacetylase (PgdA/CDA1 family)
MTGDHLRDLARRGHGVHSHSRTHPRLTALTPAQIEDELRGSKEDLEAALGRAVTQFSIPGGAYDGRIVDIARRAGYQTVMNSVEGYNDEASAPYLLRRFTPRTYSDVSMLEAICERPGYTAARLALKRTALTAARAVMGRRYDYLRRKLVARWTTR